jgi:ATP-binding cassette subfamily C (CFTR/MRP) protein 4
VVAKGGYTELQKSGLDFTSLMKDEDEEQQATSVELARSRTASSTSTPTINDEADQIPVGH